MTFSEGQIKELAAPLDRGAVKTRSEGGRAVSYIEGWHAIAEANRIFGFGSWSTEIISTNCVVSTTQDAPNYQGRDNKAGYLIAYTACVNVAVRFEDGFSEQQHADVGYGEGINYSNVGQAHESAIKEAVTDAEKRALRHWGNAFGLALYDKTQAGVENKSEQAVAKNATAQPKRTESTNANFDKERYLKEATADGFTGEEVKNLLGMSALEYVQQYPDTTADGLLEKLRAKRELAKASKS